MSHVIADLPVTFDPENHTYWYGMAQVPAVSEVMRPLTEQYLRSIPEDMLTWKAQLGTAVHKACELLDLGELDEDSLDEQIVPYLEGYKQFLVDYRPRWEAIEARVFNRELWYAGTLDRRGAIFSDEPAIVDIKTSAQVPTYTGIQLWAYGTAALAPAETRLYALQLLRKGTYALIPFDDISRYRAAWHALLTLHNWRKDYSK